MDINTLIAYLKDKDTERNQWSCSNVDTSFDINPEDYISYAEADLRSTDEHRFINALGNTKRALDCQADRLLKLLGFYTDARKEFWGFPRKLKKIAEFDIIAPKILEKINRTRNQMEHQYVPADPEKTDDFVSIVLLFIHATNNYDCRTIDQVGYVNWTDNPLFNVLGEPEFTIDNANSKIIVKEVNLPPAKAQKGYWIEMGIKDPEYTEVMKCHLKKAEFR